MTPNAAARNTRHIGESSEKMAVESKTRAVSVSEALGLLQFLGLNVLPDSLAELRSPTSIMLLRSSLSHGAQGCHFSPDDLDADDPCRSVNHGDSCLSWERISTSVS